MVGGKLTNVYQPFIANSSVKAESISFASLQCNVEPNNKVYHFSVLKKLQYEHGMDPLSTPELFWSDCVLRFLRSEGENITEQKTCIHNT